jgi:hypothetical protein
VRAKKRQLSRASAKGSLRAHPEGDRFLVRAIFSAARIAAGTEHAEVLHHRIVPRDKLLGELACFVRSNQIAKTPIDIHVTPTP